MIVETIRNYKIKPLLEESIEISKFNFERFKKYGMPNAFPDNMVTFGFGRRCGQTTAIIDLLNGNVNLKWDTLVVVRNQCIVKEFNKRGIDKVISISSYKQNLADRVMAGKKEYGIIFDSCPYCEIEVFMKNAYPYIGELKFMVNVAPTF